LSDVALSFTTILFLLEFAVIFLFDPDHMKLPHYSRKGKLHSFVDKIQMLELHVFMDGGSTT
jgi:hypothetical protein